MHSKPLNDFEMLWLVPTPYYLLWYRYDVIILMDLKLATRHFRAWTL
jgi:hypothetical protein